MSRDLRVFPPLLVEMIKSNAPWKLQRNYFGMLSNLSTISARNSPFNQDRI